MALAGELRASGYYAEVARLRNNDAACLAPAFRARSDAAIAEANAEGIDVVSIETCRSDELAKLYFAHGVSNSPDALHTWHHYGLGRDVISRSREWAVYPDQLGRGGDVDWYRGVERIFKSHGLDWGGDWKTLKDWPHWQFGGIKATPHDAITLLATQGIRAVWAACGAL
jgi:hypothetical protein